MRYERPAIEARFDTKALLGGAISRFQPVWRPSMRYERPAIEARLAVNALLGLTVISGGGVIIP